MILVWSRKQLQREFVHTVELSGDGWASQQPDFTWNSGTYIVYNSHVTWSSFSFLLTMVMPTSHFFVFHWLCCLLRIRYLPKPGSVGVRICHYHRIQPRPLFRWFFRYLRPDAPVFNITTVGMVTFRQSPWLIYYSLSGCNPVNILWYTAPVDMVTFQWSHQFYQSICQQHPPYSHPQVTLIY